jgi:hypothetical protein
LIEAAPTISPAPTALLDAPTTLPAFDSIDAFLVFALTDDESINVEGTAQNLAYNKVTELFPDLAVPGDEEEIQTIYALNTLFYATNGSSWRVRDGWTGPDPVCAPWYGVTCDDDGKVIQISLSDNDLFGELPSEIRGLKSLGV